MKLLCNPTSYGNAKKLIDLHVDQICIGLDKLSNRSSCILSFEELKEIIEYGKQNNVEVYALINKNFFDPEISFLTESLIKLINMNISGIIFADYSIPQILFENNLKTYLIYNPETLNTNSGQIDWFIENKIDEVSISREIVGREVLQIANEKKSIKVQMQICGYS
jgi:collagenase-like PrtC family protease